MGKKAYGTPNFCKKCNGWVYRNLSPTYKKCECNKNEQSTSNCDIPHVSNQFVSKCGASLTD